MTDPAPPTPTDGLGRATGVMALGTLASRVTGFARVVALAAVLGISVPGGVADIYNLANTTPNIVYELLLGGVLTSVIVPLFVEAAHDDLDGGDGFMQLFITLVVVVLGTAALVGVLAAPVLARALGAEAGRQAELTTTFLRYFLPQIAFYGLGATISAVLNTRGRFGAPMAAPVLNNLVVVATLVVVAAMGTGTPTVTSLSGAQTLVLGVGTTLGVVLMTAALLPSLRGSGFRWRWRLHRHPRLRRAARLGGWVFAYVVANQIGYLIIVRLAKGAAEGGLTAYQYAFIVFSLPHAILTVSVVTWLLPGLARHALAGGNERLRSDVSRGLRLVAVALLPAGIAYATLAGPITRLVFAYRATTPEQAAFVARVLAAFAIGLLSFSLFQVLLRVFYALQDSRTPALINVVANAVNIAVDVALFVALEGRARVVGLAVGHAVAYTVGALLLARALSRRIGGVDAARVVRTVVRAGVAAVIAAAGASGVSAAAQALLAGQAGALVAAAGGGLVFAGLYVAAAHRMHLPEVDAVSDAVRRRLGRVNR